MIMEKSPSVKNTKGKERSFITGRIRELIIPKTIPATAKSHQLPKKTRPGISLLASRIAAELAKIWTKILPKKLISM